MTSQASHNHNEFERRVVDAIPALSNEFLNTLVAELDNDDIVGITLGGSYVRGDATPYSDIDFGCFFKDDVTLPPHRLLYRDGRLISVVAKSVATVRADLVRPEKALFIVASPRHILLDKDGSVTKLIQDIAAFRWEPLQLAANKYASFQMMLAAEQVHKILSEILRRDDMAISYATTKLLSWLTEIVAVYCGVLIKSDSVYYQQVQATVGPTSIWTRYHRIVAGLDMLPANVSPIKVKAVAGLHLYQETITLLQSTMQLEHLAVAEQSMRVFREAGPRLRL
jgi:predicted nucleotidyltransferase